ncbi:TetR/AcrR family transcriptional regulator [Pseudonocardia spinosispora]|uniref:TetR/AcrR family transcriptional regulator n=1 Tax=Pseudonocardia spinosispora TaxID=103441 RepID=UPI000429ABF7|nr:TetR/AcrR family transcriptional regulator [Pseudonocardia spinosispora]
MDARERLIESTQELLWDRGYVGTSPKAILERADAGQGSMYHHFKGKSDLAAEAIRRSAAEVQAGAEASLGSPGTALTRISKYLNQQRDVLKGCRVGGLTQDPDIIADPLLRAPVDEALDWLQSRITEVLREGKSTGELPSKLNASHVASMIVAVVQGGYVLARAAQSSEPFDEAVAGALALLAQVVRS